MAEVLKIVNTAVILFFLQLFLCIKLKSCFIGTLDRACCYQIPSPHDGSFEMSKNIFFLKVISFRGNFAHEVFIRSKKPLKGQNFHERTENLSFHR